MYPPLCVWLEMRRAELLSNMGTLCEFLFFFVPRPLIWPKVTNLCSEQFSVVLICLAAFPLLNLLEITWHFCLTAPEYVIWLSSSVRLPSLLLAYISLSVYFSLCLSFFFSPPPHVQSVALHFPLSDGVNFFVWFTALTLGWVHFFIWSPHLIGVLL